MKMTRREFLLWLGGVCSLGLLGWLVGRKLQTPPEIIPETPFAPPEFAVRRSRLRRRSPGGMSR